MKNFTRFVFAFFLFAATAFAGIAVPPEKLPQPAREFIESNFRHAQIVFAETDDDFDVRLSDGTDIEFRLDGEWTEIKNRAGLALTLLPAPVAQTVAAKFPSVPAIKIEKQRKNFEIELANRIELLIAPDGKLLSQELDD